MCRWEIPYFWHDTGGNLSSLVGHQQAPSLSNTVKFLICPSVVMYPLGWKWEVWKSSSRFPPRAFCAGWFSPCFGNGHTNPQWVFSLGHHNQTWSSLSQSSVEVWSFFCVFGRLCVEGKGVRGTNSCPRLSCKSSTLQLNKLRSPRNACYSYKNTDELLTREWAEMGFQTVIKGRDTRIICHGRCWGPGKTDGIQTQDRIRETFTSWLTTLQNLTHFGHVCSCDVKSSIIAWLRWSRWWWPGKRR